MNDKLTDNELRELANDCLRRIRDRDRKTNLLLKEYRKYVAELRERGMLNNIGRDI